MAKKDGSALGFLAFLMGNLLKSMRQKPIEKQWSIVGKNRIKNLGDELAIVVYLAAILIILVAICIITLLLSSRDENEEKKIYPQKGCP